MKKNLHYFIYLLITILFIITTNLFFKLSATTTHLISLDIIILINFILIAICSIVTIIVFKRFNLQKSKNFKEDLSCAVANSFFINSLIAIPLAILIYAFLKKFLVIIKVPDGIINYTIYATKIWFISSPFIGLEITIFKYFSEIKYYKTPILLVTFKFIIFIILSIPLYFKYNISCIIYAKIITDILFLFYYTKTCFGITMKD